MKINKKSLKELRSRYDYRFGLNSSWEPKRVGTTRMVGKLELKKLISSLRFKKAKKRVRIYSEGGFVAHAYKWPCRIEYIEANAKEGEWHIFLGDTPAQRSYGQGNLLVIQ